MDVDRSVALFGAAVLIAGLVALNGSLNSGDVPPIASEPSFVTQPEMASTLDDSVERVLAAAPSDLLAAGASRDLAPEIVRVLVSHGAAFPTDTPGTG
ncbi:MAG TPA: hypothetical protein VEB69_06195 [Acidimicrobiia bacterium]|nr:hypothetical protein [Acidimicrobiia bacterium]